MATLLLVVIYLSFISIGVPDSLLGTAWPVLYRELGVPLVFVYLSEYQSGKRVSHEKIAEISFNGTESTETGMIVVVPNFEKFSASLIVADNYTKYTTENPILNDVEDRKYYGRSATSINHICPIDFGTEQGLAALVYGKNGLSMLPIQDISGDYLNTENDYMYYYSVEFTK